jgi:hypothetical protein
VSKGPGTWQREILRTTAGVHTVTIHSIVRARLTEPRRDAFVAARRGAKGLALAGRVSAYYAYACQRCGHVQDHDPEQCCGRVRPMLAVSRPGRQLAHPAPPPGGVAPAWVNVVPPGRPAGQVLLASTGDVLSLTLQRYCEQLLSGRVAVSARDVAILMRLEHEFRRDAERDRLTIARLTLTARRLVARLGHRAWRWPTPDETASWVAQLQQIAPGRADLLAEAAGVMLGAAEGTVDEPRACAAAELCRAAGADPALVPQWTEEGRRRAQAVFDRQAARVALDAAGRAAG